MASCICRAHTTAVLPAPAMFSDHHHVPVCCRLGETGTGRRSVPGTEVPNATIEMAVTASSRPMVQPKWEDTSPMKAVSRPIITTEQMKQAQPFQRSTYSGSVGEYDGRRVGAGRQAGRRG